MRTIEVFGKNVDDAIAKGLAQLGLSREQVTVKVLDEGSHGVFGLFAKLARVSLTADLPQEEAPAVEEKEEIPAAPVAEPTVEEAPAPVQEPAEETLAPEELDDSGKRVLVFLTETAQLMGVKEPGIAMARTEDGLKVRVEGPHMGALIGHRGETLDALQLLTGLVANQHHEEDENRSGYCRVTLDIGGYRTKREETLRSLALRLAEKARRSGRNVSLEPMNSYERRVIHSVLHDAKGIATHSEGDEPYRHVVISPK